MAGLDNQIIENASEKAQELEQKTNLNQLKHHFTTLYSQITKLLAHEKDSEDAKQNAIQSFIKSVQDVY
jgi:DNA mismatch repair ATPase MutS